MLFFCLRNHNYNLYSLITGTCVCTNDITKTVVARILNPIPHVMYRSAAYYRMHKKTKAYLLFVSHIFCARWVVFILLAVRDTYIAKINGD